MNAFFLDQKITYLTGDWDQEELSNFFSPELGRWLFRPQAETIVSPFTNYRQQLTDI
jgi:hypothetical protein